MDIRDTLKERGDRYGEFTYHAQICQDLKQVMRDTPSWVEMSVDKKQALEVIADKIARMLNGDPEYDDNWIDIIGYSQLVVDELHKDAKGQTKIDFDGTYSYGDIHPDGQHIYNGDHWVHRASLEGQAIKANMSINVAGHEAGDQ